MYDLLIKSESPQFYWPFQPFSQAGDGAIRISGEIVDIDNSDPERPSITVASKDGFVTKANVSVEKTTTQVYTDEFGEKWSMPQYDSLGVVHTWNWSLVDDGSLNAQSVVYWDHNKKTISLQSSVYTAEWKRSSAIGASELSSNLAQGDLVRVVWYFETPEPIFVRLSRFGKWRFLSTPGEYHVSDIVSVGSNGTISLGLNSVLFKLLDDSQSPVEVKKRRVEIDRIRPDIRRLFGPGGGSIGDYVTFDGVRSDDGYDVNSIYVASRHSKNYFSDKEISPTVAGKGTRVNLVIEPNRPTDLTEPLEYFSKYHNRDFFASPNPDGGVHELHSPTLETPIDTRYYDRCSLVKFTDENNCLVVKSAECNIQVNSHVTASCRISTGHFIPRVSDDKSNDIENYPNGHRNPTSLKNKYQLGVRWISNDKNYCIDVWGGVEDFSDDDRHYFTTSPPHSNFTHPRMLVRPVGDLKDSQEVHIIAPMLEQTTNKMPYFSGVEKEGFISTSKPWKDFPDEWNLHPESWSSYKQVGRHIQSGDFDTRATSEGVSVFGVHRKNLLGTNGFSGQQEEWHKITDAFGDKISNPNNPTGKIYVNGRRKYTFSFDVNCQQDPDRLIYRKVETTWLVTYYTSFLSADSLQRMYSQVFVTHEAAGPDVRVAFTFETPEWCSAVDICRFDKSIYLGRHPFNEDFGGPSADYIDALQNKGKYSQGGVAQFEVEFPFLYKNLENDSVPGASSKPPEPGDILPPSGPYWWSGKIDAEDGLVQQTGKPWPPADWVPGDSFILNAGDSPGKYNAPRPWDFGTNTIHFAETSDFMLEHHDRGLSYVMSQEDYYVGRNSSFSEKEKAYAPTGKEGQTIYLSDLDVYAGWSRFQQAAYSDSALHLIPGAYAEKHFDMSGSDPRNTLKFADFENSLRPFYIECFFAIDSYSTVFDIWKLVDSEDRITSRLLYGDGALRFTLGQGLGEVFADFVLPEEKSYLLGAAFDGKSISIFVNGDKVSSASTTKVMSFHRNCYLEKIRTEVYTGRAWLSHLSVHNNVGPATSYKIEQRLDSTNIVELTEQFKGDIDATVFDLDNYDPTILDNFITHYPNAWEDAKLRFHFKNVELSGSKTPTLRKIPEILVYSANTKKPASFSWVMPTVPNSDIAPRFPLTTHFLRYENYLDSIDTKNVAVHGTFTFKYDSTNFWGCDNAWIAESGGASEGDFVQKPEVQHRPVIYLRDSNNGDSILVFTYVKEEDYKGKKERFLYFGIEYRDYNVDSLFPFRYRRSMKETRYLLRKEHERLSSDPTNTIIVKKNANFGNNWEYTVNLGIVNVGMEWVGIITREDGAAIDGSPFPKILPTSQPVIGKKSVVLIGEDDLGEIYFGSFFKNKLQAQDVKNIAFGHTKANQLSHPDRKFDAEYLMDVSTFVYPLAGNLAAAQRGRIIGALSPRVAAQEATDPDEVVVVWEPQISNIAVFSGDQRLGNYDDIYSNRRSDGLFPFEIVLSTYDSWNDVPVLYNFYIAAAQNAIIQSDNSEGILTAREPFTMSPRNSLLFDNARRQGIFFNENNGYLEYAPPFRVYNLIDNDSFETNTKGWNAYLMNAKEKSSGQNSYTWGVSPDKAMFGSSSAKIVVEPNVKKEDSSMDMDLEVWSDYIPVVAGSMYALSSVWKSALDCDFRFGVSFYNQEGNNIHVDGFDKYLPLANASLPVTPLTDGENIIFDNDIPLKLYQFYQLNLIYSVPCDYKLTIQLGENVVDGETVYDLNETFYLTASNSKGGAALNAIFYHKYPSNNYSGKIIVESLDENYSDSFKLYDTNLSRNSPHGGDTISTSTTWAENSINGRNEISGIHGGFQYRDRSNASASEKPRSESEIRQTNYLYFVPPEDSVMAKVHFEFEVQENISEEQIFWLDNISLLESDESRRVVDENTRFGGGGNSDPVLIKTVGMWLRKERGWDDSKTNILIDYLEGGTRYYVQNTPQKGIEYGGFTSIYLNGEPFPYGSSLPNGGGWMMLSASIDGPNAIQPRSNKTEKTAYYNTQITEYWVWNGNAWIRRQNQELDPAFRTDRMLFIRGEVQDLYDKIDISDNREIAVDGPHVREGSSISEENGMNIVRAALDPPNELGRRPMPLVAFSPRYQNQDNVSEITAQGRWKQVVLRWVNHTNTYPAIKKYRIKVWEIGLVTNFADWSGIYIDDKIYGSLQRYKTTVTDGFGGSYETFKFAREPDRIIEIDTVANMESGDFNSYKVKKLKPNYLYAFAIESMNDFAGREQWSGTKIMGKRPTNSTKIDMRSDGYLLDSWSDAVVLGYARGNEDPEYWDTASFDLPTLPRELINAVDPWFEYYKDNSLEYKVLWLDRDLISTTKKESAVHRFSWMERPIKFGGDGQGEYKETAAFSQMSIKYVFMDKKQSNQKMAFERYIDFLGGKVYRFIDKTFVQPDEQWHVGPGELARFIDSSKSFVG